MNQTVYDFGSALFRKRDLWVFLVSDSVQEIRLPDDFDGRVRLFPLPRLVMFPNVVQPLHIFEPRYCDLLHDAMLDDGLITLATLREGWEPKLSAQPSIAPVVCIGKVFSHMPTEDNRHNILLIGVQRARIIEELQVLTPYRQAVVEPIFDIYDPSRDDDRDDRQANLVAAYKQAFPAVGAAGSGLTKILRSGIPLGPLTDIITYSVEFPSAMKEMLLEKGDVDARSDLLLKMLENWDSKTGSIPTQDSENFSRRADSDDDFAPPFSAN